MKYWLLKTEPEDWSWKNQLNSKNQSAEWNGVRNYQASNNLKNMKKKDLCFFYHTGKEKRIVGIVKVIKEHFKDKSDKTNKLWTAVDYCYSCNSCIAPQQTQNQNQYRFLHLPKSYTILSHQKLFFLLPPYLFK